MKKYLSYGGGVNSTAMMLMLLDQGDDFEAVFVNHGSDWPETYEYLDMFQKWLEAHGHRKITVLKPDVEGVDNLLEYCTKYRTTPSRLYRWCTDKFKVRVVSNYVEKPCFMYLGIDYGESKRAKLNYNKEIENRWPLIESEIDRDGCKKIIGQHKLPIPMKSGCFYCPFQRVGQWRELRVKNPDLFCKAEQLEIMENQKRKEKGKDPFYILGKNRPLRSVLDENQIKLWEEDEYPPCECMI